MEEFIESLSDYGLELALLNEDDTIELRHNIKYILFTEPQKNAYDELIKMLKVMMFRVRDCGKLTQALGVSKQYTHIEPMIEKYVYFIVGEKENGQIGIHVLKKYGAQVEMRKWFKKMLLETPEKVGIDAKELELKKMFSQNDAIEEEVEKFMDQTKMLMKNKKIKEILTGLISESKTRLEEKNADRNWYIQYGNKNDSFRRLTQKMNDLNVKTKV